MKNASIQRTARIPALGLGLALVFAATPAFCIKHPLMPHTLKPLPKPKPKHPTPRPLPKPHPL